MFLDGADGAGKAKVFKWAKQWAYKLNLTFDTRTVTVSAMSDVAVTSIGGETAHSVAAFNRTIASDDVSCANARLTIVDKHQRCREVRPEPQNTDKKMQRSIWGVTHSFLR